MRVLVTRPESEAQAFAAALRARGHEAVLAPMLRVERRASPEGFAERLAVAQAILLTSANGARALAESTSVRGYRVVAVGDATARTARQLGFTDVASASGDAAALVSLVSARLSPAAGPLVHVGGVMRSGEVAGRLRTAGFTVDDIALYETREADAFPAEVERAICDGRIDAVTFFSPRTAQAFVKLARQAGVALHLARTAAVAISPAALNGAEGISWRARIAAREPTQDGVLAALEAPAATGSRTMSDDRKPTAAGKPADEKAEAAVAPDDAAAAPAETPAIGVGATSRRGVGVLGAFVAGIVASLVVMGGAFVLYMARPELFRTAVRDAGSAPLTREALAGSLKPLDERLTQLEAKARALDGIAAQATQLRALQEKLAAQETRVAAIQDLAARVDALPKGGDGDVATRLAGELAQARQDLERLRVDLTALRGRQEATDATLRAVAASPPSPAGPGTAETPPDMSRQVAALNARLDQLEKREAQVAGTLSGAVDSAALARAVGESEARLRDQLTRNTVEIERAREATTKLAERLGGIEKDVAGRIEAVRKDVAARSEGERRAGDNGRAAAAIGIAARLRQAIDSGGPFIADADLLKPLAAGDQALAAIQGELAPFASTGVATRRALAAEFPEIARRVIAADLADDSWGERFLGKLRQLVSIRRVGDDTKGATPEAVLARAEAALEAGDLAKAVGEMKAISGAAIDPARDWLVRAEAHLAAQRAIDRLSLYGIGLLSRTDAK